jgi:hypothetical protein
MHQLIYCFCLFGIDVLYVDASSWLFYTKLITMHGRLNINYENMCIYVDKYGVVRLVTLTSLLQILDNP